jgi:cytochrome oxidase Cu insertion factor (SCO1/SenC/PrrC family)
MTSGGTGSPHEPDELSDEQRAAIFAAANAPRDHRGNVRAPRAPIPKKFVLWAVVAIVFLGVGGQIAGHFFQSYGKAPKATTTTSPTLAVTPTTLIPGTSLTSLETFIGVKFIASAKAHSFTLKTQSNKKWTLSHQKGKVVVLAFYDSICNDICPVLGTELREAAHELAASNKTVEFAIVNTDPQQHSVQMTTQALSVPGLSSTPSVVFLTGNVATLDTVWRAYGIRIIVGAKRGQVSHNNALYFIGPKGDLVAYANPFASESTSGVYSLSASVMHRYAQGIAATASSLVK